MSRTVVEHNAFEVGWICALSTEFVAACELLDEEYSVKDLDYRNDENSYAFGRIGRHNVVISCLPKGRYGITSAATVARDMLWSFPSIRFGLMVGIGGGAPSKRHDIRLGDIVVGCPSGTSGGVINYQYGKSVQDSQFVRTGSLASPPRVLLSALNTLIAKHERYGHKIQENVRHIVANIRLTAKYRSPGWQYDCLFGPDFLHQKNEEDCEYCCMDTKSALQRRLPRDPTTDDPVVHYGLIASADSLMKDARLRNQLAQELDVLCFEMEAAGLMDHFPCLVIRGICDYCDTHKNKRWHMPKSFWILFHLDPMRQILLRKRQNSTMGCFPLPRLRLGLEALARWTVHGIGGDVVSTWKTLSNYSWLRDWLAKVSGASILSYGYDSAMTWSGDKSSVRDTAIDLLERLNLQLERKYIFLCHGLGGVIVKIALAIAQSSPKYAHIREQTSGLIFLGTPQGHLHVHEWMLIVYRMANVLLTGKAYRLAIMEKLEQLSNTLNALSFEYPLDVNHLPVLSLYETVPVTDAGSVIVEPETVILTSAREEVLPLKAQHPAMAAPGPFMLEHHPGSYASIATLVCDLSSGKEPSLTTGNLLQKLHCIDYELYSVSVPDASPRTGTWLWDQPSFQSWAMSEDSALFWARAPPGFGKTVIAKGLVRDLKTQAPSHPGLHNLNSCTTLAFFFREDISGSTSMVDFLRSVLHQMLLQFSALGPQIQSVLNSVSSPTSTSGYSIESHLNPAALWKAFESVLHNKLLSRVVLVIDGLDEANQIDISEICYWLLKTLNSIPNQHTFKIFLVSRDNYDISKGLEVNELVKSFDITSDFTHRDIEIFLDNAMADFVQEHSIPEATQERIKNEIAHKADGMFLWAKLAWDHFIGGVAVWSRNKVKERLEALESLPPGLNQLYVKLLQKIDKDVLQELYAVFLVIAVAARPLVCEELEQLLGIKGWEIRTTDLDIPFSIRATIKIHCAGLLKISPAGVIRVIHLSLKDFLRDNVFEQRSSRPHSKTAGDCIHYLTLVDVRNEAERDVQKSSTDFCLMTRFPLYDYAATYLSHHMKYVDANDPIWLQYASITKHYAAFHTAASALHASHINEHGLKSPSYYQETPLRHAIRLHGTTLIRAFASESYDLDETVRVGVLSTWSAETAMHRYIRKHAVVQELLAYGASPNTRDYLGRTPLHLAILQGKPETTKMLLASKDIDVNVQDAEGLTPLHYEATSSRGSILLNDNRADVHRKDKRGRTALDAAAFWGDYETTIEFLRSTRNVMAHYDGELSILIAAAQQNWLDVSLNVLNQLPDVSYHRGHDGRTILHWAVINDWEEVLLRAITQAHAEVNATDQRMRTPLHEAAELGNFKLARKLIARGASARCQDQQGRTPVQLAAIQGFSDTVLALTSSDWDINDADHQQRTIVHWAASCDWSIIMRRVLEEPEVNLLKHDCMGRTALHIAALCGCPNVLQLLTDEEVFELDETDSFGNSLLHLAARGRSTSVVDILLQSSGFTRTHAVNKYGQTALDVAILYGADAVEAQLRSVPVRVQKPKLDTETTYYKTCEMPEQTYHTDWVLVLVDKTKESFQGYNNNSGDFSLGQYQFDQPEIRSPPYYTPARPQERE